MHSDLRLHRAAALVLGLLLASSTGCGYNRIQGADEEVKAAWSEVSNQYQRRADLIPNLVETVKGSAKFERETLEAVIKARASATKIDAGPGILEDPARFQDYQEAQGELSRSLGRLLVTVEAYPDIKSTQAFRDLQAQLEGTENRIAVARKRYIESVSAYNKLVRFFPTNLTARFLLGMEPRPNFEAEAGAEEPPEVQF
jgi:LemA protein